MNTPKFNLKRREDIITEVRRYELITPLFGGGVKPQEPDPVSTVRAASVRGQLRFWWRATRGGQFASLDELRKAEEVLWGGAAVIGKDGKLERGGPGLVQVEVEPINLGVKVERTVGSKGRHVRFGDPESPISYGAFPLRDHGSLQFGVVFLLRLRYPNTPDIRAAVAATLWGWETFGGIGARTRRGFGALHCFSKTINDADIPLDIPANTSAPELDRWLTQKRTEHIVERVVPLPIPHLLRSTPSKTCRHAQGFVMQVGKNQKQFEEIARAILQEAPLSSERDLPYLARAMTAWYAPLWQMQRFRQSRRQSESTGSRFGRSHWPEPDEIRSRTVGFKGRHSRRLTSASKFPRAAFGLPIVFQFKDDDIDPPNTTLVGVNHGRHASRLILRPIVCADRHVAGVATILEGPALPPNGLKLEGDLSGTEIDLNLLTRDEAGFAPLSGRTDILRAFLDTL